MTIRTGEKSGIDAGPGTTTIKKSPIKQKFGEKVMKPFFCKSDVKIDLQLEDVIPGDINSPDVQEKNLYISYIRAITRQKKIDDKLYCFRRKALRGDLKPTDYKLLNKKLENLKKEAQQENNSNNSRNNAGKFAAYAQVKSFAMFISQILFVDNSIKEGLLKIIPEASKNEIMGKFSECIKSSSEKNKTAQEKNLNKREVEFYATLFTLQAAFDKIFVPDEEIVHYKVKNGQHSGEYEITHSYESATRYLFLTNQRCIEASKEEYDLCYNITTGWSQSIDLATWNALNQYYYNELSPTTKLPNLFASNYDVILERMLPQFAYSKVRCAEEILKHEYNRYKKEPLNIIEIGAGSGAFAIDLFMACLRLKIDTSKVRYVGLEPNKKMQGKFKKNASQKTGISKLPKGWRLLPGDLESFTANPSNYLDNDKAIIVLCYCAHHCFNKSILQFFASEKIKDNASAIYILDVVKEHGWTKPYYMWADCESPENFDNVAQNGIWNSQTLWQEPNLPIEGYALTNAWCYLRKLTILPAKINS